MIFTCNQVHMQDHERRKDFVQNTTRRVEIFLKTRRACPCAVGDVLTLQSKNVFQNSSSRRFCQSSVGMEHAIPYINQHQWRWFALDGKHYTKLTMRTHA